MANHRQHPSGHVKAAPRPKGLSATRGPHPRRTSVSVDVYTHCDGCMPPRVRRAGARKGALSPGVRQTLRAEAKRLSALEDDVTIVRAVGDAFAALDGELERIAKVRLRAVQRLRSQGWSYDRIAQATGLSKGRVAQLSKDERRH